MKNSILYIFIFLLALSIFISSCRDESLDPIQRSEIKPTSLLALREADGSDDNFFFKDQIAGDEIFTFVADFISEDQDLLESVEVYARILDGPRSLVATIPGSSFSIPSGAVSKRGTVSVPLNTILTALSITDATTIGRTFLNIESDLKLTDGSTVFARSITNTGYFSSNLFFPAQILVYRAEETKDFVPKATPSLKAALPLKSGAKDTLFINFNNPIKNTPTITYSSPDIMGGSIVKVNSTRFYQVVTGAAGTGTVTATISGAISDQFGVDLVQNASAINIGTDNTAPEVISTNTGSYLGEGQFAEIKVTFNEKLSKKTANALKVNVTDPNGKIENAVNQSMTVAANGLSASYFFIYKQLNPANPAVHGPLSLSFTGGSDEAGNPVPVASIMGSLVLDLGTPPSPVLTLSPGHDLGNQIKWSATQSTGSSNPGGSTLGTVYFVAIDANSSAPTGFTIDADGNGIWTMASGVTLRQSGKMSTTIAGTSGTVYSTFSPNGTFDVYAVFAGNTGNVGLITSTPQLEDVVMN